MNKVTENLIRELAEKLGTTSEYLWEVLLKQAYIAAVTNTVITVIMLIVLWSGFKFVYKKTNVQPKTNEDSYPSAEWEEEGAFVAWLAIGILCVVTLIQACCAIDVIVTASLNPEFWALQQLIPNK